MTRATKLDPKGTAKQKGTHFHFVLSILLSLLVSVNFTKIKIARTHSV